MYRNIFTLVMNTELTQTSAQAEEYTYDLLTCVENKSFKEIFF